MAGAGLRRSYATIAEKLKFGKVGEERFENIKKALGSILEEVSKNIRETEGVWNKDVKFSIANQTTKLKAIDKEISEWRRPPNLSRT